MAQQPSSVSDSHGSTRYHSVFIDTSLDTHIVTIVSDVDTVADLKKKIQHEHRLCFSSIGEIKIHALKVRRKGCFYHLSDSMFVRSAFHGVKKTWYLYLDASNVVEQSENQFACNPHPGNLLLCLPSADRVDLQLDESSKKLSVLGESSLPEYEVNLSANEKVLSADELGSGDPVLEHLKVLEVEVKHNSDDRHRTSFVSNKKFDPEEKCNPQSGETAKGLKTESVRKKKQKVKSKMNPVGNAGIEVPNNMKMVNKQVSDDPAEKTSSETSKRSDYWIQKKHEPCQEIQAQGTHVECQDVKLKDAIDMPCNSSLGGISQPKPAAKKKRKTMKNDEPEGPQIENEADFSKETSETKISSATSLENKKNIIHASLDGLPIEPPEPNSLIGSSSSTGKKKRKKKSSGPCSLAVSVPSENDARQENSKVPPEVNLKDSDRKVDTVNVSGLRIPDTTNTTACAFSLKEEKCSDLVQVVEIPILSSDVNKNEADARNMGRENDVSEVGAAYEVKRRKGSNKHHAVDRGDPPVKKLNSLEKDLELSESENVVSGDHLKHGIDQTDKIEEEREISPNNDPNGILSEKCGLSRCNGSDMNMKEVITSSKLFDADAGVEHKKPAIKRKKSKKAKNTVEETLVGSTVELAHDPLNSLKKDLELSESENVVSGDHLKLGIDQTDKIEEEREISLNNDPNGILYEKAGLSRCNGSDMNMKEVITSSELFDANAGVEHKKPAVKRKKSKKAMNTVEEILVGSTVELAHEPLNGFASLEPHKAFDVNHSSNEADKGEIILSRTERAEVLKSKVTNTFLSGVDREIDVMSGNERESSHLADISKSRENIEDMVDDKVRKKTKKHSSTAINLPDLLQNEQDVGPEVSTSSACKVKVDAPPQKRKTRSVKTNSTNQFKRSKLESEKDDGTEVESLHPKQDSGTFDSPQIPSYKQEKNSRPLEVNVNENVLEHGHINKANDHKEVSSNQDDKVHMPRESLHEVVAPPQVLADQDTKVKRSGRVSKTNKNKKMSSVSTSDQSSKTSKNNDVETKPIGDNQLQDPLSMDGHSKLIPDRKFSEVARNDRKSPPSHDIGKFDTVPEEVRWPNPSGTIRTAHAFLKENGEASLSTYSSDSSEDSAYKNKRGKRKSNLDQYRVTVRKAPNKNTGEVVNSSNQRKSLLATSRSIFSGGGSETSDGDDGVVNSDASTRTPSDSSASSDYTEGERNQHVDSFHGLHSGKRNEIHAKSIGRSNSSGSKNVSMDAILRSSSRFKKAKLTASQSELNDTESQPVEFVPDSQPNS